MNIPEGFLGVPGGSLAPPGSSTPRAPAPGALDLWEAPPTDLEKVELFVEVRPRWPLGPRDPRSRDKPQMKPHAKQQKKKGGGKRARDKEGSDGAKKAKGASADGA